MKKKENGVGSNNIKSKFTQQELKKISGNSNGEIKKPVNYVYIGISCFGDIIEVGRTSVTSEKKHGDWVYEIRIQKGISLEYLEYCYNKTEGFNGDKSRFFNELLLNLNKFYERIVFIPIEEEKNKEKEIASEIEKCIGKFIVKPFSKEFGIDFVSSESHLRP